MMKEADSNGDGKIGYSEFLKVCANKHVLRDADILVDDDRKGLSGA